MNSEKARLDKMLQEQKISKNDYKVLATALKRKTLCPSDEGGMTLSI